MGAELIAAPKIGASAPGIDATQKLALSLTDDLVKDRRASDANLYQAIKVFGENGLNEIIMLVGCYVLACMLLRTWGIEIEQPKARETRKITDVRAYFATSPTAPPS